MATEAREIAALVGVQNAMSREPDGPSMQNAAQTPIAINLKEAFRMTAPIAQLLDRRVDPASLRVVGSLTRPPSWGVYDLSDVVGVARRYRIGNHPVRQRELEKEFGGCCRLYALFTSRDDAVSLSNALNGEKTATR